MLTLAQVFHTVRRALDQAGVTYAIGGSWASSIHGEPRHTNDIDFVTNLDPRRLLAFLPALGPGFYFRYRGRARSPDARPPVQLT